MTTPGMAEIYGITHGDNRACSESCSPLARCIAGAIGYRDIPILDNTIMIQSLADRSTLSYLDSSSRVVVFVGPSFFHATTCMAEKAREVDRSLPVAAIGCGVYA